MCMYVCMCVCVYVCVHVCTCMYVCTIVCTCMYDCKYMYMIVYKIMLVGTTGMYEVRMLYLQPIFMQSSQCGKPINPHTKL